MHVTCTHCVHEFEIEPAAGAAEGPCPACGRVTPFRSDEEAAAGGMFAKAVAEAEAEKLAAAAEKPKEASLLITIGEVQRLGHTLRAASSSSLPAGGSMLADIRMIKSVIAQQEEQRKAAKQEQGKAALLGGKPGSLSPMVPVMAAPIAVPRPAGRPSWVIPVVVVVALAVIASSVALVIVMGGTKKAKGGGEKPEATAEAPMQPADMTPPPAPDAGAAMAADMSAAMTADAMKAPDPMAEARVEPMIPPRPAGPIAQLGPAEIEQGIATVKDRIASCSKGQPGDYPFNLTVDGKTGKVTIAYLPRNKRGSATGKCLMDLMGKAQFPVFTQRKQVVRYTANVK